MINDLVKFTLYDISGRRAPWVKISVSSIISISPANPSGCVITCTRGAFHVAQGEEQVDNLINSPNKGK